MTQVISTSNVNYGSAGMFQSKYSKYPLLDGDADGAPAGGDAPPPPKPAAFTPEQQELVNGLLKKERSKIEEKVKKADERAAAFEASLAEIKGQLETKAKDDPAAKTEEGRLEILQRKHQRDLEELKQKLTQQEQRALKAEKDRIESQRDTLINEALVAAGCHDIKGGYRYFAPDVTRVDEDGEETNTWFLKSPSGKLVDIQTGVMEHLPKYLRGATQTVGGSGTISGGPKAKDKDRIKALEGEVAALHKQASASGGSEAHVLTYLAKKRELASLKAATKV